MKGIIRANTATNFIEASGKSTNLLILPLICGLLSTFGHTAGAAELLTLSPENYDRYVPQGNEVDAIFGDYVLRNDRITVVVANPDLVTGRSSSRWFHVGLSVFQQVLLRHLQSARPPSVQMA